jgi:hypothetical protein
VGARDPGNRLGRAAAALLFGAFVSLLLAAVLVATETSSSASSNSTMSGVPKTAGYGVLIVWARVVPPGSSLDCFVMRDRSKSQKAVWLCG